MGFFRLSGSFPSWVSPTVGLPSASLPPHRVSASSSPQEEQGSPQQLSPHGPPLSGSHILAGSAPQEDSPLCRSLPPQWVCPLRDLPLRRVAPTRRGGRLSAGFPSVGLSAQRVRSLMDLPSAGLTFWQVAPLRRTHRSLFFSLSAGLSPLGSPLSKYLPPVGLSSWQVSPPWGLFPSAGTPFRRTHPSASLCPQQVSPQWDLCPHGLPLMEALPSGGFTPKPPLQWDASPHIYPKAEGGLK